MSNINQIYKTFHNSYGPQGWWPLSKGKVKTKHHMGPPTDSHDRWEIIVGAILTQNTAWTNVERAIENLNRAKVIKIESIKKASVWKIAELIKPSGYFRQKAERLKIAAEFFSKNNNPTRDELLSVKGIGPETADSILLYAFEKPNFVIDSYTKRIFSRIGVCDGQCGYDELQQMFMKELKQDVEMFKEYHALIVEHAKRYCNTKPKCDGCIIKKECKRII